ncbi:tyrosine-type recombinase/integrase [candidate division KSB3 bacterium]|nr:tyrosine-type recombinase/integrase [candidate division KSB3 bacterium]
MTSQQLTTTRTLREFEAQLHSLVEDGGIRPATVNAYLYDARQLTEMLEAHQIHPLHATRNDLVGCLTELAGQYAPASVNRKLSSIQRYYRFLEERKWVQTDPTSKLELPKVQGHLPKSRRIEPATAAQLVEEIDVTTMRGLRDLAIITLITVHGLRVHQIHHLNTDDVDLDCGMYGCIHLYKSSDHDPVFLTPRTHDALRAWLSARRLRRPRSPALFLSLHWSNGRSESNRRLSRRSIRATVNRHLKEIGAKVVGRSCDALRFTLADAA